MMSAMNAVVIDQTDAKAGSPQVGTWQWDIPGRAFVVDPTWCAALGLDACVGPVQAPMPDGFESWARRIHPDDVGEFRRRFEATRLGKVDRFELEYRVLSVRPPGSGCCNGAASLQPALTGCPLAYPESASRSMIASARKSRSRKTKLASQQRCGAHAQPSGSGTSQPTSL